MHSILTKRIEMPHVEIPWLARIRSIFTLPLIPDPRGRPACWLFAAFCVTALCFWYPDLVIWMSPHDPYLARAVTGVSLLFFPFAVIASLVALFSYIVLWRRARKHRGVVSRWLLSVGSLLFLVALAPGLEFMFIIVVLVVTSFRS